MSLKCLLRGVLLRRSLSMALFEIRYTVVVVHRMANEKRDVNLIRIPLDPMTRHTTLFTLDGNSLHTY